MKHSLLLLLALLAIACDKDNPPGPPSPEPPDPGKGDHTPIDNPTSIYEWEYKYLSEWYLWPETIGPMSDYNSSLDWQRYFTSMLSRDHVDGHPVEGGYHFFSNIERQREGSRGLPAGEVRPGFRVDPRVVFQGSVGDVNRYLVVMYVDPTSDAAAKGLKRGMLIAGLDGERLTTSNFNRLYEKFYPLSDGGTLTESQMTLSLHRFTERAIEPIPDITFATMSDDENPILMQRTLTIEGGKKVGYFHYLQFRTGFPDFENAIYHDELKRAMRRLADERIDELVLDLRFNPGGAVITSQMFTSILAPSGNAGKIFAESRYNPTITARIFGGATDKDFILSVGQMDGGSYGSEPGVNLGLSRLYVLVSEMSASSSELLINALRGLDMPVHLIGTPTTGKTVGMIVLNAGGRITSSESVKGGVYVDSGDGLTYSYSMSPVSFSCVNAKGTADYEEGFTPTYLFDELADPTRDAVYGWRDLGTQEEPMLSIALHHIATGSWPPAQARSRAAASDEWQARPMPVTRIRPRGGALILPPAGHE